MLNRPCQFSLVFAKFDPILEFCKFSGLLTRQEDLADKGDAFVVCVLGNVQLHEARYGIRWRSCSSYLWSTGLTPRRRWPLLLTQALDVLVKDDESRVGGVGSKTMLEDQRDWSRPHIVKGREAGDFECLLVWERIVKDSEHGHVRVVVNASDVHVEVIRYGPLHAVSKPVAHSIILVSEVSGYHDDVLMLLSVQLLEVALWTSVNDDWPITLVTHHYSKLVHSVFVLWEFEH